MSPPDSAYAWLRAHPRVTLGHLPTPLEAMDRLSEELGGPRLWLKRDDCTGLATGGNKTRKLEFLLADALAQSATRVITFGAIQSNHARQTAAACARVGLACDLFLSRQVPWSDAGYEVSGNVLFDQLFGAQLHMLEPEDIRETLRSHLSDLKAAGERPYVIPAGGSNAVGARGYVGCAVELLEDCPFALTDVLHASSSAGTQAGLLLGFALAEADVRVHGVNVYHDNPDTLSERIRELLADAEAPAVGEVLVDHRYRGEGYGLPNAATLAAVRMVAELEGVLLDPVYSGKAMAAMIDRVAIGEFSGVDNLVFVHTGGSASLSVYSQAFS